MAIAPASARARLRSIVRGDPADPAWTRPALWAVVALAAVLYLWQLSISGYANEYYASAAQAGSQSWTAFFFGALDASGFITVDKPPAALWLMGLSVRLFGLSSWSILLPQALCGIATVVVLHLAVRRSFGAAAGVVAALVLALTPVAVLIFRYDNPDALLTLLLVSAAWATTRAIGDGRTRWVVLVAVLAGFAFLTKYLQAYVAVPAFLLAFVVAAPGGWRHRAWQLLCAGVALVLASGWWVIAVEAIPAGVRPHIGGTSKDSVLDLLLGYDGLGRIFGAVGPGGGGAPGGGPGFGGGFGGASGPLRMLNPQWGGQVAWLIPAATIAAIAGVLERGRAPRTDPARAGFLLWGAWLALHVGTFSFASGIVHPYYAVAIAPAIAALVGGGLATWWRARVAHPVADAILAMTTLATAAVAYALLGRTPDFLPLLAPIVVATSAVAAVILLFSSRRPRGRQAALTGAALALVAALLAPAAYAVDTTTHGYAGGDPSAGPAVADRLGSGGFGGQGGIAAPGGSAPPGGLAAVGAQGLDGRSGGPGAALLAYLLAHRGSARWIVAVESSSGAAPLQLATGAPVMAMGGFNGADPFPTADELTALVASGDLRYVYLGGRGPGGFGGFGGFGGPGSFGGSDRGAWVEASCTPVDYGGSGGVLYDCAPSGAAGGTPGG